MIRLGGRLEDLSKLLEEVRDKIAQQEEAADQCEQVIDTLRHRAAEGMGSATELQEAMTRAEGMMATARQNLERLYAEQTNLQAQYEQSLRKARTVRVRKNIMPGTVIHIQGAELAIKRPTGPATVIKCGDALGVLPFKELDRQDNGQKNDAR